MVRAQLGMIEATQPQADHQDHRQAPLLRDGRRQHTRRQRHQPAANAFHHHHLVTGAQPVVGIAQRRQRDRRHAPLPDAATTVRARPSG
jgi:hypothetical protein